MDTKVNALAKNTNVLQLFDCLLNTKCSGGQLFAREFATEKRRTKFLLELRRSEVVQRCFVLVRGNSAKNKIKPNLVGQDRRGEESEEKNIEKKKRIEQTKIYFLAS